MTFDRLITELNGIGSTVQEEDTICYLLSAMPSNYDTIITSIETMSLENKINIDFVKARLLDAEIKYKTKEQTDILTEQIFCCYTCGKRGHKSFQCKKNQQEQYNKEDIQRYGQGRGRSWHGAARINMRGRGRPWQERSMMRGREKYTSNRATCAMDEDNMTEQWLFTAFGEKEQ
ncbi:uncharacterized protein LOC131854985 [Achroia grisella]|uniref:uncharacterized protein LOC131854985 n=1 Tax=Achroia grisella TaxID=688607 RepID=UPI0027D1F19A|nr:uncharacterized protein LOC131854985 [Achroia grisella]